LATTYRRNKSVLAPFRPHWPLLNLAAVFFGEIRWLDLAGLHGSRLTSCVMMLMSDHHRQRPLRQASVAESSVVLPPVIREHTYDPSYPP
jgi:hypothetical protein